MSIYSFTYHLETKNVKNAKPMVDKSKKILISLNPNGRNNNRHYECLKENSRKIQLKLLDFNKYVPVIKLQTIMV